MLASGSGQEYRKTDSTKNDKKISTTGITSGTDFYNSAK